MSLPEAPADRLLFRADRLLRLLNNYRGLEVRERQLITDFTVAHEPSVSPDDVLVALRYLERKGLADRACDPLRGTVWVITKAGREAARTLVYAEDEA